VPFVCNKIYSFLRYLIVDVIYGNIEKTCVFLYPIVCSAVAKTKDAGLYVIEKMCNAIKKVYSIGLKVLTYIFEKLFNALCYVGNIVKSIL